MALVATLGSPGAASQEEQRSALPMLRRPAADQWDGGDVVPGSVMVTTARGSAAADVVSRAPDALAAAGVQVRRARRLGERVVHVEVPPGSERAASAVLERRPGVMAVEPERVYRWAASPPPDDPLYPGQWPHAQTGIEEAWERVVGSPSTKVAVLDSGVDGTHPDLQANIHAQVSTFGGVAPGDDGVGPAHDNAGCPAGSSGYAHGTAVAGVVAAHGSNGTGVSGVAWRAGIIDVALTGTTVSACEGAADSAVIAGLEFVADHHPDTTAVNLSFGTPGAACPAAVQAAIDRLRQKGVTVVAAAGNDASYRRMVPAGCNGVVAVGATGPDGSLAGYSNRQRYIDVVAPGGDAGGGVPTTYLDAGGGHTYASPAGTSFAAPYVAGVVALAQRARDRQGKPRLVPRQVEAVLEQSARHPSGDDRTHDERHGWGLLHAGETLLRVIREEPREPWPNPLVRWARGDGVTEPVTEAVAVSQALFAADGAKHVVLARADDYADALAGSALGFGMGPVLFTPSGAALNPRARNEIARVLPPGGRVYVLGGPVAVDPAVDSELAGAGYEVVRLAGPTREHTAVAVAEEVPARLRALGYQPNPGMILATRGNWPDAVAAGSLAAAYGLPVLLTPPDFLHPATAAALADLETLKPDPSAQSFLYVIGGTAVIEGRTANDAVTASGAEVAQRLGGPARDATAVAVASELEWQFLTGSGLTPTFGIAVNLDRPDAYAPTLAASAAAALTASVFVPVRQGPSGVWITPDAEAYACGLGIDALLPGDTDLLPAGVASDLQSLYDRSPSRC